MPLKKKVAKIDEIAEPLRAFYKQDGAEYVLDLDGSGEDERVKTEIKEFRAHNIALLKERDALQMKIDALGDVKPEEIQEYRQQQEKIKKKELVEKGEIEPLLAAEKEKISAAFTKRLDAVQQKNEELEKTLVKLRVTDELNKAAAAAQVRPEAIEDVVELASREWVLEGGVAVRKRGQEVVLSKTEVGKNQSMPEFFIELAQAKPYYFQPSSGSGGKSPAVLAGKVLRNPTPLELGGNAEAIAKGEITVQFDNV